AVGCQAVQRPGGVARLGSGRRKLSGWKRVVFLLLGNLFAFSGAALLAEVAFRMFWSPRYWIHCDRWLVGSGQTEVGKKWWPNTTYSVEGAEFRLQFSTNASGYRARPESVNPGAASGAASLAASFREGWKARSASPFGPRLNRLVTPGARSRRWFCETYGVSAPALFASWHRIIHAVLPVTRPTRWSC